MQESTLKSLSLIRSSSKPLTWDGYLSALLNSRPLWSDNLVMPKFDKSLEVEVDYTITGDKVLPIYSFETYSIWDRRIYYGNKKNK